MDEVLLAIDGPVATITINRPEKLNALNAAVVEGLNASLAEIEGDNDVRVVVLRGAGTSFSSGFDLAEEAGDQPAGALEWSAVLAADVELTMRLWRLDRPTIAAVRGYCLAGGCELAMACDLIVCSDDSRFGEPEIRYGSGPVTLLMPFVLGEKKTNELLYTGSMIAADEALRCGLVNRVVPADELESAIEDLVRQIVPTPLAILRLTKRALRQAYESMGVPAAVAANLQISSILNSAQLPEQEEFDRITRTQGLREALRWRDARYGEAPRRP
jgi:enoyl-CoA hydratase